MNNEDDPEPPTTDQQIEDALSRLPLPQQHCMLQPQERASGCDMDEMDREENQRVEDFLAVGCGCTSHNGGPCSMRYHQQQVLEFRADCFELTTVGSCHTREA